MAVQKKHPEIKLGVGPVIENGFYYDLDFSATGHTPNVDCLSKLEELMSELIKKNIAFIKKEISVDEANKLFASQPFKLELIKELTEKGSQISVYTSGDFMDLCAGPHIENSSEISEGSFKLTKISGAYWKGDEKNPQMTRIYGVAFDTKDELEKYLKNLEEAEKRDHRVLAEKLDLFMVSEDVGKGLPLWLPNGAFIRHKLEEYMYEKELAAGYKYVYTPVLTRKKLYETSGHLAHYREDMYNPIDIEGEEYYLKPMNCPHHHMIYNHKPLSYRNLPLRLAEFGLVHRFERSGVLTGLIRARCFTQNDSHIYCRRDQIKEELLGVLKLFKEVYDDFNVQNYWFRLSLPDFNNKEKYGDIDNPEIWNEASGIAREVLQESKVKFVEAEGEASFYGPKIDVQIKNVLGKEDTIATCQIDFYSSKRFDLFFINDKGEKEHPAVIHRAIMGSFDRFFSFLIEQTAGNFPVWLCPIQALIIPVSEKNNDYAKEVNSRLLENNIRVQISDESESLGKRIREAQAKKIPYILVVGEKEVTDGTVAVRDREGKQETVALDNFISKILEEIQNKK